MHSSLKLVQIYCAAATSIAAVIEGTTDCMYYSDCTPGHKTKHSHATLELAKAVMYQLFAYLEHEHTVYVAAYVAIRYSCCCHHPSEDGHPSGAVLASCGG